MEKEKMCRCNRKRKHSSPIRQTYLDLLPPEILKIIIEKMLYADIEKAGDATTLFGAVGRQLVSRGPLTIMEKARKKGGRKGRACLAAMKALSTCGPIQSPIGVVLDACNDIVDGARCFSFSMEMAMSAISTFGMHNNRVQMNNQSPSLRRNQHIYTIIRILQSFNDQSTTNLTLVTLVNPMTIRYKFTLLNCWLGLVWRESDLTTTTTGDQSQQRLHFYDWSVPRCDWSPVIAVVESLSVGRTHKRLHESRRNNLLYYENDREELQDCLMRLSLVSNAGHTFRQFKRWNDGNRTCVMGHVADTKRNKLNVEVIVRSSNPGAIQRLQDRLKTPLPREPESAVDDTFQSDNMKMIIHFDCSAALSWGCDRKFSYNVGWDEYSIDE